MTGGSPGGVGGAGGQAGGTITPGKIEQHLLFFLTGASGLPTIKAVAGALEEPVTLEPKSLRTMVLKGFLKNMGFGRIWLHNDLQKPLCCLQFSQSDL